MVVKGEDFVVGAAVRIPVWHFVFSFDFFFILYWFIFRKSSQMPLNQTDVAVDEELEKVVITIYSSTETDIEDNELGYAYSSGETTETSSETEACLQLGLRMHTVPNIEI